MATLADSFLDDLDELGESSDDETQEEGEKSSAAGGGAPRNGEGVEGSDGMEVRCAVRTHTGQTGPRNRALIDRLHIQQ